jgi:hypothetical protein
LQGKLDENLFDRPLVELYASPNEHRELVASTAWQDIKRQIEAWLTDVRDALEDPENILLEKTFNRLAGNAEALRRVLMLPEVTIKGIEDYDIREV